MVNLFNIVNGIRKLPCVGRQIPLYYFIYILPQLSTSYGCKKTTFSAWQGRNCKHRAKALRQTHL